MSDPVTAREALLIEAIGEVSNLIDSVDRLTPELQEMRCEIDRASTGLRESLAAFEGQVLALTEKSKVVAVKHILAHTQEAARQATALHSRAMADAARVAFGAEVGAALQRLKALHERPERRWELWLTHAAAAATASAGTLLLTLTLWAR
ncbi:MAG: hypothetical protein Q8N44_15435 [Rubrivivax sp.]|nr:hypothetical protein [Rubrivivax sp.]